MLGMQRSQCATESWLWRNVRYPLCFDARRNGRWRRPATLWSFVGRFPHMRKWWASESVHWRRLPPLP